jgi:hypothetical protein
VALQNFIDKTTVVTAAWLNSVDSGSVAFTAVPGGALTISPITTLGVQNGLGITISQAGNVNIAAATSGVASLTVNGVTGGVGAQIVVATNQAAQSWNDGTHFAALQINSALGSEIAFGSSSNHALALLTNGVPRVSIGNAGAVVVNAPSSGTTLTVVGVGGGLATPAALVTGTDFQLEIQDTAGAADSKYWGWRATGGLFGLSTLNDARNVNANAMFFTRSGTSITGLAITAGNVTIAAPASGIAFTANAIANARSASFVSPNTAGQSFGPLITAGTNSSDNSLVVNNAAGAVTYFQVRGDGAVSFPAVSTTASAANAFLDNAASNNLLRSTSSGRYKQDVRAIADDELRGVFDFRPITYRSKAEADDQSRRWIGLIAEDVAAVQPMLVHYDAEHRPDGVQYDRITVLLLALVQKLYRQLSEKGIVQWDDGLNPAVA